MAAAAFSAPAQNIDFDFPNRNTSEVTEPGYIPWPVNRCESESKTLDDYGITITLSAAEGASALASNWNKQTVQAGMKLFGDGVYACRLEDGNAIKITEGPSAIVLTIEGLTPGRHSLLAYHNNTDKNQILPPIRVTVDGVTVAENVFYSSNADNLKASEVGRSYVEFTAAEGKPVVITYATVPDPAVTYTTTAVMINGLEFEANPYAIMDEYPAANDRHVDADDGSITFRWKGADLALSHCLVYGTDSVAVAVSAAYQYEGSDPEFRADGFSPLSRYWWRVDEVDASGTVHKGRILSFQPRRIAFPSAEGYGRFALGGRGGIVYHVTSLEDDADLPGTLRYGIERIHEPRTIVFDVAGEIRLNSRLVVSDRYVTIAGQTAPGRGILLRDRSFGMQSDGITRFMRLFLGGADDWNDSMGGNPNTADGMGMSGNDHSIMDHCSIAWSIDEGFSSRNARNMTLQRTIISEALNYAGHATQYANQGHHVSHGYAATIGGGEMGSEAASFHHNLLAHCEGRNWSLSGGLDGAGFYDGHHDVFNNVVYNWGGRATDGGTHELNFVNNYYKKGPATTQNMLLRHQFEGVGKGTQRAYVSGNIREELNGSKTPDKLGTTYNYSLSNGQVLDWEPWSDEPFFPSHATVEPTEQAFKNVLSDVGCNMPQILNHDSRIVDETLKGTTSTVGRYTGKKGLPDCESDAEGFAGLDIVEESRPDGWDTDADGIPDWFEYLVSTDPMTPNNNDDRDSDSFTDLEEYLDWISVPNFHIDGSITVDLAPLFAGYRAPVYRVEGVPAKVTKELRGSQLTLTPAADAGALFSVRVTAEEEGVSLTRRINFAFEAGTSVVAHEVEPEETDQPIFDLLGRRVLRPTPGIYVSKGRKIVVR
ncbi:MAG: hypothetical protein K2K55_01970 [Duncaniella sp.]|nr:hypothetical protein [Duncaniella sp.]